MLGSLPQIVNPHQMADDGVWISVGPEPHHELAVRSGALLSGLDVAEISEGLHVAERKSMKYDTPKKRRNVRQGQGRYLRSVSWTMTGSVSS